MAFVTVDTSQLDTYRLKIQARSQRLPGVVRQVLAQQADTTVADLSAAAPQGNSGGMGTDDMPVPGDAPGALSQSFDKKMSGNQYVSTARVITTQPHKLGFVRYGTGIYGPNQSRIVPAVKQALWWAEAAHPYASVAGQQANDFVSPILAEVPGQLLNLVEIAMVGWWAGV